MATVVSTPEPLSDADENVRQVARTLLGLTGRSQSWLGVRLGIGEQIKARFSHARPHRFTVAEVAAMARIFGVPAQTFFEPPSALLRADVATVIGASTTRGKSTPYRHLSLVTAA